MDKITKLHARALNVHGACHCKGDCTCLEMKVRHVNSPEGANHFNLPIGAPIVKKNKVTKHVVKQEHLANMNTMFNHRSSVGGKHKLNDYNFVPVHAHDGSHHKIWVLHNSANNPSRTSSHIASIDPKTGHVDWHGNDKAKARHSNGVNQVIKDVASKQGMEDFFARVKGSDDEVATEGGKFPKPVTVLPSTPEAWWKEEDDLSAHYEETVKDITTSDAQGMAMAAMMRKYGVSFETLFPPKRKGLEDELNLEEKTAYSNDARMKMAKDGHAMPDGSFPIMHWRDMENAVREIARSSDPTAVREHIIKRAIDLKMPYMIPSEWTMDNPDLKKKLDMNSGSDIAMEAKTMELAELKSLQNEIESLRVAVG